MSALPPGFALIDDQPTLPPGFRLIDEPQRPSSASDAAKQTGVGIGEGAIGLVGLPGDLKNIATYGAGWLLDQGPGRVLNRVTRGNWDATTGAREAASAVNARNPTGSRPIRSAVEAVTGEFPEPQTLAGGYARTIGRNVPAAALVPGGMLARGAMAVVPGVAEETAGQATKGTWAEPYARAGAGIAAGLGTAAALRGAERAALRSTITQAAPTPADLRRSADNLYTQADEIGLQFSPREFRRAVEDITVNTARAGIDAANNPRATSALNRLQDAAGIPRVSGTLDAAQMAARATPAQLAAPYAIDAIAPTLRDVETMRRVASNATVGGEAADRAFARKIVQGIDEFTANPGIVGSAAENAADASRILSDARAVSSAGFRSNVLDEAIRRAELRAGSAGAGTNIDNAMRQQIRRVAETPHLSAGFTNAERDMLREIIMGTRGQNALRLIGKAAPTGSVSAGISGTAGGTIGSTLGTAFLGPAGTVPGGIAGATTMMGVGQLAKNAADKMTRQRIELLSALTRARSPAATKELQALIASDPFARVDRNAAIRRLLLAQDPVTQSQ